MMASVLNLGGGEILVIALIALLVLGPNRLPGAGRQIGKALAEFRRMSSGVQEDLRQAMDVDGVRETVAQVREALDVPRAMREEVVSAISAFGPHQITSAAAPPPKLTDALPVLGDPTIPSPDGLFADDVSGGLVGVAVPPPSNTSVDTLGDRS
jgi:sec-independent protein translocase protein TatA